MLTMDHGWRSAANLRAADRIAALLKMRKALYRQMLRAKTPKAKRDLDIRHDALAYAEIHEEQLVHARQLDIARETAPWFEVNQ